MDIIEKKINDIETSEEFSQFGYLSKYGGTEDERYLPDVIDEICKLHAEQYDITEEEIFDSPSYTTGIISIAYILSGKLNNIILQWEMQ